MPLAKFNSEIVHRIPVDGHGIVEVRGYIYGIPRGIFTPKTIDRRSNVEYHTYHKDDAELWWKSVADYKKTQEELIDRLQSLMAVDIVNQLANLVDIFELLEKIDLRKCGMCGCDVLPGYAASHSGHVFCSSECHRMLFEECDDCHRVVDDVAVVADRAGEHVCYKCYEARHGYGFYDLSNPNKYYAVFK